MYIEQILELLDTLDGAGLTVENPELIREELVVLGYCSEEDTECEEDEDD